MVLVPFLALFIYTGHVVYESANQPTPYDLSDKSHEILENSLIHPACEPMHNSAHFEPLQRCTVSPSVVCYVGDTIGVLCIRDHSHDLY